MGAQHVQDEVGALPDGWEQRTVSSHCWVWSSVGGHCWVWSSACRVWLSGWPLLGVVISLSGLVKLMAIFGVC